MKKLLIVSLFLLSMIGLMAQAGTPYLAIFNTHTADGTTYHPEDTIGFMVEEYHTVEMLDGMFEEVAGGPRKYLYWNWPGQEDLNTGDTYYDPTTGQLSIQMATLTNWYNNASINARFWFIDGSGNYYPEGSDVDPALFVDVAKLGADQHIHADPINWGGPVGPTPVLQWATVEAPLDGAPDVALDTDLAWAYPAAGDEVLAADGFEVWVNGSMVYDGPNLTYAHNLAYETPYTWYVKPYTEGPAKRGMKASRLKEYPEGEVTEWTFTTMAEPTPLPSLATLVAPVPEEGEDMAITEIATTLEWAYEGSTIDGFEVTFNGNTETVANDVFEYPVSELAYNTTYEWSVRPFRNPAAKGMKASREGEIYPEDDPVTWSFTTTDEAVIPGDIEITIVVPVGGSANAPTEVPVTIGEVINDVTINEGLLNFRATINQAPGTYTFTFAFGWSDISVWIDGVAFNDFTFVDGNLVFEYTFTAKKEPIEIFAYDPNTLPVELSSFTAQAHANEYVTLKWVTESESNLHGYNVYRAETENQDQAIRINPSVVAANNETQTQTYTYTDNEVEATTYYYWLEVSELANENSFYGPKVVTVEDDPVVPGITETVFRNFGPSPFSESTSTSLRVKEGETATVTIYNLLGQVVSRESFNAGEYNFEFNGRDLNNKKVANGIYFVRMTSPTQSRSFKIVKMK